MKRPFTEKEWVEDFNEFVQTERSTVPPEVSKAILDQVRKDLNPNAWVVFAKIFGIHTVVSILSLSICDQFGMSPFRSGFSLSDYFMRFGHSTCMVLCGVVFVGGSVLLAYPVLRHEEVTIFRKNLLLQVFSISVYSLVVLLALGAQIAFSIGILWLAGAVLGGVISDLALRFLKPKPAFN